MTERNRSPRTGRRARTCFAVLLTMSLVTAAMPAEAVTSAQKIAQARLVKSQVDALDTRVSIADEEYLQAADKHATLVGQARHAAARVAKAEKHLRKLELHLGTRADSMYRTGPLGFLDVLLGARTFDQLASTWDILKRLNASDAKYISQTKDARAEASAAHAALSTRERAAARQLAVMSSNKRFIQGQLAQRQRKLAGIESEVARLQAQEEAARAAAASSRYAGSGGGNYPAPSIPAHGNVVDYARSRLGLPYVWAASGPSTFDCSGLTMWAYARVGISLPHSSRAQINVGQRVSRKDLAPGDLVFFGSPIHHVGIYIGGGRMIEAPHSGANVRIGSIDRSDYVGASRP